MVFRAKNITFKMDGHDQLLGGYWFMKALFYSSLISYASLFIIDKICLPQISQFTKKVAVIGLMLFVVIATNHYHFTVPFLDFGSQPFYAALFFIVGHCFASMKVPKFKNWQICLAFLFVFIAGFFWRMETGDQFYSNKKLIPAIFAAVLGTWSIYSLPWERLKGHAVSTMKFIGNNTLTILTWHFLSFKIVSLIIITLYHIPISQLAEFPVISSYAKSGWWVAYVIVSILVCCLIVKLGHYLASLWNFIHKNIDMSVK